MKGDIVSKGSKQRLRQVDRKVWSDNYDQVYKKESQHEHDNQVHEVREESKVDAPDRPELQHGTSAPVL
jgi:DNA topoisomerase IA